MTLTGYDLSSHNTADQINTALAADFVILKATEGVTYRWMGGPAVADRARAASKLLGWYHYAHPETNSPEAEAAKFVTGANALPGEALILDFEPPSIEPNYPVWVSDFSDMVWSMTKADCWLYINQYQGNQLVKLASPAIRDAIHLMPLWKAYYQATVGDLMGWPDWTCWQYTSTPFDTNEFNGDADKWRALGVPGDDVALTQPEIDAIVKAVRADAANTKQNADGSWPLGSVIEARVANAVASVVRSEGLSGAGDVSRFVGPIVKALGSDLSKRLAE